MTQLDIRLRAAAERMIASYGKAMTLRRQDAGAYSASTATDSSTATDYAVVGVISTPSQIMIETGAQAGDSSVLLAASAVLVVPQAGDVLLIDDVTWQVMAVRSVYSGTMVAYYELLIRS